MDLTKFMKNMIYNHKKEVEKCPICGGDLKVKNIKCGTTQGNFVICQLNCGYMKG